MVDRAPASSVSITGLYMKPSSCSGFSPCQRSRRLWCEGGSGGGDGGGGDTGGVGIGGIGGGSDGGERMSLGISVDVRTSSI